MLMYLGKRKALSLPKAMEFAQILVPKVANAKIKATKKRAARFSNNPTTRTGFHCTTPYIVSLAEVTTAPRKAMRVSVMGSPHTEPQNASRGRLVYRQKSGMLRAKVAEGPIAPVMPVKNTVAMDWPSTILVGFVKRGPRPLAITIAQMKSATPAMGIIMHLTKRSHRMLDGEMYRNGIETSQKMKKHKRSTDVVWADAGRVFFIFSIEGQIARSISYTDWPPI